MEFLVLFLEKERKCFKGLRFEGFTRIYAIVSDFKKKKKDFDGIVQKRNSLEIKIYQKLLLNFFIFHL